MPSLLYRAAATALLACSTVAQAQQQPVVRVRREQQLVLAQMPAGSEPELRVAPGLPTLVRFDAELVHAELKREGAGRSVSVDPAGHSLLIEAQRELTAGERLPLDVVLAQGQTRTRLLFQLVSNPGEVDARVSGVTPSAFQGRIVGSGVLAKESRAFRAERGRAIVFYVNNPVGARPWFASEVVQPMAGTIGRFGHQRECFPLADSCSCSATGIGIFCS